MGLKEESVEKYLEEQVPIILTFFLWILEVSLSILAIHVYVGISEELALLLGIGVMGFGIIIPMLEGQDFVSIFNGWSYINNILLLVLFFSPVFALVVLLSLIARDFSIITDIFANPSNIMAILGFAMTSVGVALLSDGVAQGFINPQALVKAYRKDNENIPDIEILEAAYSKAQEIVGKAFLSSLGAWLVLGLWSILASFSFVFTVFSLSSPSDPLLAYILFIVPGILSGVSFVLAIVLYLRKRSIEKALFAIQLKKSDKAEISIKI